MSDCNCFLSLTDLAVGAMDILFPHRCAACGKKLLGEHKRKMCSDCRSDISFLQPPVCKICGMELKGDKERSHICGRCLSNPPPYLLARSVVQYSSVVQKLLHGLKYGADTSVLPGIAEILSQFDLAPFDHCDHIIPVPLHVKRLRQRGLNQSVLLAKIIFSNKTQSTLKTDFLIRARNTVPQTTLNGVERRKNLKDAFIVAQKAEIGQSSICLVDDVFTTGTTVSECSRVLCRHGAKEVKVITFTRVESAQCGT